MTANAITALHLGNFKAFANTQRIPIRPLTLIYGPNSSGKSSIIHSLLLARHAMETGELDVYRTNVGGEAVDLGGFGQYVYRRDRKNRVEWGVDLDPRLFRGSLGELLSPAKTLTISLTLSFKNDRVQVESFSIEADRQEILYMSARGQILRCDRLNYEHPVIEQIINAIVESYTTVQKLQPEDKEGIKQAINDLVLDITAQASRWFPPGIQVSDDAEDSKIGLGEQLSLFPVSRGQRKEDLTTVLRFWLSRRVHDLVKGVTAAVDRDIKCLRYLGPFRSYPPRHYASARQQDPNWEAGGGAAWQTLLTDSQVRQKVNYWLGNAERMQTPYELVVRELLPNSELGKNLLELIQKGFHDLAGKLVVHAEAYGSDLQEQVQQLKADIENKPDMEGNFIEFTHPDALFPELDELVSILADIDTLSETWADNLAKASTERVADLVLIDKRSQTPVSHRDIGIGVSQVLPILVSCYALSETLVAIEQPEIHLHPRLQAELGDVFIESALGKQKNNFILETHSEHLLLRIMRRMRETCYGDLPEGLPAIHPEDISVLYVQPDGPQSIVQEIPLNKRGELVKAWPGGFFEEGLEEVFA